MSVDGWRALLGSFLAGRLDAAGFHDRFFDEWHAAMNRGGADIPEAIEALFFVVEAYCPDPSLRTASPYEADDTELAEAVRKADARLASAFQ